MLYVCVTEHEKSVPHSDFSMGEEVGAKENKGDLRDEHNLKKENVRSHSLIYWQSKSSSTKKLSISYSLLKNRFKE